MTAAASEQSTRITRDAEKARFERVDLDQLLDTVHVGHVGAGRR